MLEKEGYPDYVTNLDFTDLAMKFFQNKENLKQSSLLLSVLRILICLLIENC